MFELTATMRVRIRSAVRAANAAITRRAKELEAAGLGELVDNLPPRFTISDVEGRIKNRNDFRRIVGYKNDLKHGRKSELTRILRTADPHALDFDDNGLTRYENKQTVLFEKQIQNTRDKSMKDAEGISGRSIDDMSSQEYAVFSSDNDLMPDDAGELDDEFDITSMPDSIHWHYEDAKNKATGVEVDAMYEVYRATWVYDSSNVSHIPGYSQGLAALDWLADNRPTVLNGMFAGGADEMDPYYISESDVSKSTPNPYINIDFETRRKRAANYIVEHARAVGWRG